ncbi:MAG: hypothetical protein JWR77_2164, partial [Rhizorhabdus sp.]|nr:hypothetical protein [Rhizorhabdus sp.]
GLPHVDIVEAGTDLDSHGSANVVWPFAMFTFYLAPQIRKSCGVAP